MIEFIDKLLHPNWYRWWKRVNSQPYVNMEWSTCKNMRKLGKRALPYIKGKK